MLILYGDCLEENGYTRGHTLLPDRMTSMEFKDKPDGRYVQISDDTMTLDIPLYFEYEVCKDFFDFLMLCVYSDRFFHLDVSSDGIYEFYEVEPMKEMQKKFGFL